MFIADHITEIGLKKTTQQITTPVQAHRYTTASLPRDESNVRICNTMITVNCILIIYFILEAD